MLLVFCCRSSLQLSDLQEQLQQKLHLITRLEEDLLAVRQGVTGSAAASSNGHHRHSSSGIGATADVDGSEMTAAGNPEDAVGNQDSMLRVLVGQRERLRARVQELEVQLASAKAEMQATQQELAAARADNIALIERLRYVGGYRQQVAAARSNAAVAGKGTHGGVVGGDVEMAAGADVVGKYSQLYDESLNPFKEFQVGAAGCALRCVICIL
jgi:homeobox protein cut-like